MDLENLKTASAYINNLLLARGLLRNGDPIEFARPHKAKGGMEASMGQIINLVHDMVLRRDRETEALSSLSSNLQTLRAASSQQAQDVKSLDAKNADLERRLALCTTREKNATATLRSAGSKNRILREEMARLRLTVAQIRAQCANDIRKRDAEMARLKKHLEGRRGRDGGVGQIGVVVITPGITKPGGALNRNDPIDRQTVNPEASLKDDTAAYLTELSRDLTAENQSLSTLLQDTLTTLLSLQGLPTPCEDPPPPPSPSHRPQQSYLPDPNVSVSPLPPSFTQLANSLASTLSHLRTLLTSPAFVPLEELEAREEEIVRLRAGWEKMEARWHEAVAMMSGWRRRMEESGDTINLEDLQQGLTLGAEAAAKQPELPDDGPVGGGDVGGFDEEGLSVVSERTEGEEEEDTLRLPAPTTAWAVPRLSDLPIPHLRPPTRLPALSPSPPILSPPMPGGFRPLSPTTGNHVKAQPSPHQSSPLPPPVRESPIPSAERLQRHEASSSSPDPLNHLLDSPATRAAFDESSLQSDDPANLLLSPYLKHGGGRVDDGDPLFDFGAVEVRGGRDVGEGTELSVREKLERVRMEAEEVGGAGTESGRMGREAKAKPSKGKGRRRSTLSPDELLGLLGG